jgi:hypothetical protein
VPTAPDAAGSVAGKPTKIAEHLTVEDYERAAEAILKRLPEARASARTDELPFTGHIPLPKKAADPAVIQELPMRFSLVGRHLTHGQREFRRSIQSGL